MTYCMTFNAKDARTANRDNTIKIENKKNKVAHKFLRKVAKQIRKAAKMNRTGITVEMPQEANWQTIMGSLTSSGYTIFQDYCTSPRIVICW